MFWQLREAVRSTTTSLSDRIQQSTQDRSSFEAQLQEASAQLQALRRSAGRRDVFLSLAVCVCRGGGRPGCVFV